jgi:lipoyl(octanoyl) transferase
MDSGPTMIAVVQLGTLDYAAGLRLQEKLVGLRKAGQVGDVLLLLEHTPVITLGRNAKAANVLASAEQLAARGVEVYECDRGGDVTFHGPGQLVGYPIFDLRGFGSAQLAAGSWQFAGDGSQVTGDRSQVSGLGSQEQPAVAKGVTSPSTRKTLGAVDYVRSLEEALIRTCADFGIPTKRVAGMTGVWTEAQGPSTRAEALARTETQGPSTRAASLRSSTPAGQNQARRGPRSVALPRDDSEERVAEEVGREAKIAAIGVHISRSVTSHGFALNVNTDLSFFDLIVPCGIAAKPVTSIKRELGREVEMAAVAESVSRNFGSVFGSQMLWVETVDALLRNAVGVPVKAPKELRELHGEDDLIAT